MESVSRPLGGISALKLGVVSQAGAAPTLESQFAELRLLEDRSTYTKEESWSDGECVVKHCLKIYTPIEYSLPLMLNDGLEQGFAAVIELNTTDSVEVVGICLEQCTTVSGKRAAERGYKEWIFRSAEPEDESEGGDGGGSGGSGGDDDDAVVIPLTSLVLVASSAGEAAPQFATSGVEVPLFGALSTYSEKVEYIGSYRSVSHSLKFATSMGYVLPAGLEVGLDRGFAAHVELNDSYNVTMGWSAEATTHRPLRLTQSAVVCSSKSDSVYYKEWLLESVDGATNI